MSMNMNSHNWLHLVYFAVHLAGSNVPIFNALYGLYQMTFDRSECSFEPFFKGTFSQRSQTLPQQELPCYKFLSQHGKALRQRRCTSRNYVAHSQRRERFECKALRISTSTGPRICRSRALKHCRTACYPSTDMWLSGAIGWSLSERWVLDYLHVFLQFSQRKAENFADSTSSTSSTSLRGLVAYEVTCNLFTASDLVRLK